MWLQRGRTQKSVPDLSGGLSNYVYLFPPAFALGPFAVINLTCEYKLGLSSKTLNLMVVMRLPKQYINL
jgi:hypothetical protein